MCWHYDAAKTFKHADALAELCAVCDEVFLLDDKSDPPINAPEFFSKYANLQSVIRLDERDHHWNDWTNHNTLMLAAAKRRCNYILWLDDDESIYPRADRGLFDPLLDELKRNPCSVAMSLHWDHVWNEVGKIRVDGEWSRLRKPFLQKNPFFTSGMICFQNTPLTRIHSWPIQSGTVLLNDTVHVLHYALMTSEDRTSHRDKYVKHDPQNEFALANYKMWEYMKDVGNPNPELKDV
jgi:hypothetical protein